MTDPYWLSTDEAPIVSVCFGTGRFLRSVLVPLLQQPSQRPPVLIQTRSFTFLEFLRKTASSDDADGSTVLSFKKYPVETVNYDGTITTDSYEVSGAFSLGTDESRQAVSSILLPLCAPHLRVIGVGVTEKGLSSPSTPIMSHLALFLRELADLYNKQGCTHSISIINTDNVPLNGSVLHSHMMSYATEETFRTFLETKVVFHVTMVDRIVSHRPNDPLIPRSEPFPAKALVVLDPTHDFLLNITKPPSWLVARGTKEELDDDIALKLQIANGTHTALACVMAVCGFTNTDQLLKDSKASLLLDYVDSWVECQVLPSIGSSQAAQAVWDDWRKRLTHPHFGLSTFFITQNSATKGGIRLGPTVRSLLSTQTTITATTAFAYASLLRFLTPTSNTDGAFRGWCSTRDVQGDVATTTYADGLRYNLKEGWYEFRCEDTVAQSLLNRSNETTGSIVRKYLTGAGQLPADIPDAVVDGIATLYDRMVAGDDPLSLLQELKGKGFQTGTAP